MNPNKICPHCDVEYLPHVERCADCGRALVSREEHRKMQEERERLMATAIENTSVVREGDLKWLGELYNILIDSGIPCTVTSDAGCNKGCRPKYRLIVSNEDLEMARERIEEYFTEIHPEIRASNELIREGRCPACGSPVGAEDMECADCGLTLMIVGEEKEEDR